MASARLRILQVGLGGGGAVGSGADNLGSLALRSAAIDSADQHALVTLT